MALTSLIEVKNTAFRNPIAIYLLDIFSIQTSVTTGLVYTHIYAMERAISKLPFELGIGPICSW